MNTSIVEVIKYMGDASLVKQPSGSYECPTVAKPPKKSKKTPLRAQDLAGFSMALYQLVETLRGEHEEAAAAAGLTAPQATLLTLLSEPMSMRQFAELMGCDASNVTGIVDRLEAKGMVMRTADPGDRRVKRLARTAEGDRASALFQKQLVGGSSLATLSPRAKRSILLVLEELERKKQP